jgi:hypothetical protein
MPTKLSPEVLHAAIEGFESQKRQIDTQITELRQILDGHGTDSASPEMPTRKHRKFSAAARRRMREAQRRRWAAARGETAPSALTASKAPKRKRHLSEAGRKAIIAATKKRWARKRAEATKRPPAASK